jgi:hypothetical protein
VQWHDLLGARRLADQLGHVGGVDEEAFDYPFEAGGFGPFDEE